MDDRLKQVGLEDALADPALGAVLEQPNVGHDRTHPALGVGYPQHMRQEGQVTPGLGRDGSVAIKAVVGGGGDELVARFFSLKGGLAITRS